MVNEWMMGTYSLDRLFFHYLFSDKFLIKECDLEIFLIDYNFQYNNLKADLME